MNQAELSTEAYFASANRRPPKVVQKKVVDRIGTVLHTFMHGDKERTREVPLFVEKKIDRSRYTPEKLRAIRAAGKNR